MTAFQATAVIELVGTLRYVPPSEGKSFCGAVASGLYGNDGWKLCPFFLKFTGAESDIQSCHFFAEAMSSACYPDSKVRSMRSIPILRLAADDMKYLVYHEVANVFGDSKNVDILTKQREEFLTTTVPREFEIHCRIAK